MKTASPKDKRPGSSGEARVAARVRANLRALRALVASARAKRRRKEG